MTSADTKTRSAGPFAQGTLIALALISIVSFIGYVVLSAYSDELDPGQDGSTHALSRSAVGFAGIVRLMNATEPGSALLSRGSEQQFDRSLNIVTLDLWHSFTEDDFYAFPYPVLIVLPKWSTRPMKTRRGWVEVPDSAPYTLTEDWAISTEYEEYQLFKSLNDTEDNLVLLRSPDWPADTMLSNVNRALFELNLQRRTIEQPPEKLQTITGDNLDEIIVDTHGRIVVGHLPDTEIYILADPDLLNNAGIADLSTARFGLDLINALKVDDTPVFFDLTKHGFERTRNMMKLALEPPFGAATLTLFLAALVLAWRSSVRFGPPRKLSRAYALGKRALADNSAALIRMAGREHRYANGYADLVSRQAARALGAPRELHGDALTRYLDRYAAARQHPDDEMPTIFQLKEDAAKADNRASLLAASRRLFQWKQEFARERR